MDLLSAGAVALLLVLRAPGGTEPGQEAAHAIEAATGRSGTGSGPAASAYGNADAVIEDADRETLARTMERAVGARLDTLPIGDRIFALGRRFVDAPYTPGTLEILPERRVVNLREFDCVTYVEAVLAMARLLDGGDPNVRAISGWDSPYPLP